MRFEVEGLGFSYDGKKTVFSGIDFDFNSGEIICILGPNGIGKTTLLACMAKLLEPTWGRVRLDGKDMKHMTHKEVARMISYVPQTIIPSFDYTVLNYVVTGLAPWLKTFEKPELEHYKKAEEALEDMEILHLKDKPYTQLSGGELQQVSIARALTQQSRIILMDEPTAHLDYGNQLKVLRIVKKLAKKGLTIVLTTHNPDQILLLEGKVAVFDKEANFFFGDWEDILSDSLLTSIYGTGMKIPYVEEVDRKVCVASKL